MNFLLASVIALLIFASGMIFINHVKDDVTTVRDADALDCNNLSVSDGTKVTCLGADIAVPYVFLIILSLAGGVIAAKLTVG